MTDKPMQELTAEEIAAEFAAYRPQYVGDLTAHAWNPEYLADLLIALHHRLARIEEKLLAQ